MFNALKLLNTALYLLRVQSLGSRGGTCNEHVLYIVTSHYLYAVERKKLFAEAVHVFTVGIEISGAVNKAVGHTVAADRHKRGVFIHKRIVDIPQKDVIITHVFIHTAL